MERCSGMGNHVGGGQRQAGMGAYSPQCGLGNLEAVVADLHAFPEATGRGQNRAHGFTAEKGEPHGLGRIFVQLQRLFAPIVAAHDADQQIDCQTVAWIDADGLPGVFLGFGGLAPGKEMSRQFGGDAGILQKKTVVRRAGPMVDPVLAFVGFSQGLQRLFALADFVEEMGETPIDDGIAAVLLENPPIGGARLLQAAVSVGLDGLAQCLHDGPLRRCGET